jgi:putative sigma-54 modulation protein
MSKIQIDGVGLEITDSMQDYIERKNSKLDRYKRFITNIKVRCKEAIAARGVEKDLKVEYTVDVPNTVVRVEKKGEDFYSLVDEITDVMQRKLERYKNMKLEWGKEGLPEDYEGIDVPEENAEEIYDYKPEITKRKGLEYCGPMHEAEAVERMELSGQSFFLFRNSKTGLWSVVYRRDDGTYGIIEPLCE